MRKLPFTQKLKRRLPELILIAAGMIVGIAFWAIFAILLAAFG